MACNMSSERETGWRDGSELLSYLQLLARNSKPQFFFLSLHSYSLVHWTNGTPNDDDSLLWSSQLASSLQTEVPLPENVGIKKKDATSMPCFVIMTTLGNKTHTAGTSALLNFSSLWSLIQLLHMPSNFTKRLNLLSGKDQILVYILNLPQAKSFDSEAFRYFSLK